MRPLCVLGRVCHARAARHEIASPAENSSFSRHHWRRGIVGGVHIVPLPQVLAEQEFQARGRQARETLALLDPSLQSALEVNAEVRWQVKLHLVWENRLAPFPNP